MAIVSQQTTAVNTPSIQSGTTALNANTARTGWYIVNVGTNPLYVLMGNGASATVWHIPLAGASVQDNGTGGSTGQEYGVIYTGIITVYGVSPRYICTEFAA